MRLFAFFTLPYWRRRRLKALLTLLGMASGIAVYTAIDLANRSALHSFETSVTRISGNSDLVILGRQRPLRNSDFVLAQNNPATLAATPIIEAPGLCGAEKKISFTLLGIDPLTRAEFFASDSGIGGSSAWLSLLERPGQALLPDSLAKACGIRDGEEFPALISGEKVTLKALVASPSDSAWAGTALIFTDIATAQESLRRQDQLSRVEVQVRPGAVPRWLQIAEQDFPAGLSFRAQEERLGRGRELLKAFQLNLLALGLVAVFVAVFIVYNSASISVLHRRRELATLRALGATRGQLATSFAWEVLLLGTSSSLLGILLGTALARAVFVQTTQTIHNLYLKNTALQWQWSARSAGIALALGLGAAWLGAFLPLREVLSANPAEAMRPSSFEKHLRHHPLFPIVITAFSFTMALVSAKLSSIRHPGWGFATAFGLLLGFLTLTPGLLRLLLSGLSRFSQRLRWGFAQIACSQIAENPYRYGVVTAALALGVALWLGISLMINSFRGTVEDWIGVTIRGDIYLTLRDNPANGFSSFLPPDFDAAVAAMPGIARRDELRVASIHLGPDDLSLSAVALRRLAQNGQFQIQDGDVSGFTKTEAGGTGPILVAVSESLARRHGLRAGDRFSIDSEWGPWELQVGLVLYDYTSERGTLYVDLEDFQRRTGDRRIQGIALYLQDPRQAENLLERIRHLPTVPPTLESRLNREVRTRILAIFDQTFRATEALKFVALFVAFLGILTTLAILMEEKRREIGLLQAVGMSPRGLTGYGLSQGIALAACGFALGACCGIALCWVIIRVINYDHFGWTIFFRWDPLLIAKGMALTLGVGIAATTWSTRYLQKIQPSEALRFEE